MTLKHTPTLEKSYDALISTVDEAIKISDRLSRTLAELGNRLNGYLRDNEEEGLQQSE